MSPGVHRNSNYCVISGWLTALFAALSPSHPHVFVLAVCPRGSRLSSHFSVRLSRYSPVRGSSGAHTYEWRQGRDQRRQRLRPTLSHHHMCFCSPAIYRASTLRRTSARAYIIHIRLAFRVAAGDGPARLVCVRNLLQVPLAYMSAVGRKVGWLVSGQGNHMNTSSGPLFGQKCMSNANHMFNYAL